MLQACGMIDSAPTTISLSPPGVRFQNWGQSHSSRLEEGVILPFTFNASPRAANADWVHEAWTPLGLPRRSGSCAVECVCAQRCFSLNRGSVDCRFADMLRHSQCTLMVIAVSTGLERARLLAWHSSCLPLSELRAVTLRRVTETQRKKKKKERDKREFILDRKKRAKAPNSEVPAAEVIYRSLWESSLC